MMFHYLNVDFEDKLYSCGEAPDYDKSVWLAEKETLGMDYPNLPYLLDGETKISETAGIMMYIAKKWRPSLLGETAAELGKANMLWDAVLKLKMALTVPCYTGAQSSDEIIETCKPLLAKIAQAMGDSKWIAGSNLTWLDFYFAEVLDMLHKLSDGLFYAEFPSMQDYWDRFIALENLSGAWADDTKLMKSPFNNKMA